MTTHNGCTPDWREIRYADGVKLWVCDNCGAVRKSRPRVGKISQHPEDVVPGPPSPDTCPPNAWNPLVTNVTRETSGNIEVNFSTVTGQARGTAVTMAANGATSWAYSADQNTWDSRQWTPDQARPTYNPQPLTAATVPAAHGTPPVQYATDPQRTGMQPNAATPDPDHFKEVGDRDWFLGQAAEESNRVGLFK